MKTLKKYFWLLLMTPLLALTSCGHEEIVFDYENEHFDTQNDKILLEVVVPTSTQADDEIYVIGEFNGGMDAVGNEAYKLTIHPNTTAKWGVYLDGNTDLSKGYWFYSKSQREERELKGDSIVRHDSFAAGSRNLLTISRWAAYFDSSQVNDDDEVEHDGYALFVLNESSEKDLALYAWGDAEAFGGWPGIPATGTQKKSGVTYTYFDLGKENEGLNLHLIPNNNGGGVQWEGDDLYFTIDHDIYIRIWDGEKTSFEVLGAPEPQVQHDGYVVYLFNASSETNFALYAWGDEETFGGWPGTAPTGTQTIKGNEYIYFDMTEARNGLNLHLIPNNNGSGVQWEGDALTYTVDHDIYIRLNEPASAGDKTAFEVLDGPYQEKVNIDEPQEPQEPKEVKDYKFYFKDETGWDAVAVYAWGAKELFGAWPGTTLADKETIEGVEYYVIAVQSEEDAAYNLILNNTLDGDDKIQYDAAAITLNKDFFFTITATACNEITE